MFSVPIFPVETEVTWPESYVYLKGSRAPFPSLVYVLVPLSYSPSGAEVTSPESSVYLVGPLTTFLTLA